MIEWIAFASLLGASATDRAPAVAALYIDPRHGPYPRHPRVASAVGLPQDARLYDGPWPVVAHPPCAAWGRYRHRTLQTDQGEVASTLAVLQRVGGVLEHPEASRVWSAYGLPTPIAQPEGRWVTDGHGWWSAWTDQGRWGHVARKRTWLLWRAHPEVPDRQPPALPLPPQRATRTMESLWSSDPRRWVTPEPFAALLVELARAAAPPGR